MRREMTWKEIANMTWKEIAEITNIYVSDGNTKLVSNEEVKFIVFSLPSRITCPYRTAHCESSCYAVKAEVQYSDCLPSRFRNLEESKKSYIC